MHHVKVLMPALSPTMKSGKLAKWCSIYGINCGNFGFLMNEFDKENFLSDIENAKPYFLHHLESKIFFVNGTFRKCVSLNDIHITRCSPYAKGFVVFCNHYCI